MDKAESRKAAISILSDPKFDAEFFIKTIIAHTNNEEIARTLFKEAPALYSAEYHGNVAANAFRFWLNEDIGQMPVECANLIGNKVSSLETTVILAIGNKCKHRFSEWILEHPLKTPQLSCVMAIASRHPDSLSMKAIDKLYDTFCEDMENLENLADILSRGDERLERLFVKGAVNAHHFLILTKVSPEVRLRMFVDHVYPQNSIDWKNVGKFVRQITLQEDIQCPKCGKDLGSFPGLTLHLQSNHRITPKWDTRNAKTWRYQRALEKYASLIEEVGVKNKHRR